MRTAHRDDLAPRPRARRRPAALQAAGPLALLALLAACGEDAEPAPAAVDPAEAEVEPAEPALQAFTLAVAYGVELRGTLRRSRAPAADGALAVALDVQDGARGLRALYEIEYALALAGGEPVELRAGDRLMYTLAPIEGGTWTDVLRAADPEAWIALRRVEGAAEER